jgi:hypothetical protein
MRKAWWLARRRSVVTNQLGRGVIYKLYHYDNLDGAKQEIYIADINLNDPTMKPVFLLTTVILSTFSFTNAAGPAALFNGKTLDGWIQVPTNSWTVKDGAMASTGDGRGAIYTTNQFRRYRLMFTMRHVSGQPDHQACFLIFCTKPATGEKARDALAGIQFQVPNGGHWDYRPGHNNPGNELFKKTAASKVRSS